MKKISVNLFYRKPYSFHYSIERIFDGMQDSLNQNESLQIYKKVMPFYNNSILGRFKNILWTSKNQSEINHITGDIHYIALGLAKNKAILTIHDLYFINQSKLYTYFIYYLLWLKLPLLKVQFITVVSEATKKEVLKRISFPEQRIRVIPNFIDPNYKSYPKKILNKTPVILQIGTKTNKNIPCLIAALEGVDCRLTIIGKHEKAIESLLHEKKIVFDWKQNLSEDEVMEQYKKCDIVCFTSIEEGFGMPILEAQAIGRVVITSNISSMPEVAGAGAYLVDPFDPLSIKQGIYNVINDDELRLNLINNGFENVKRFDISKITTMYFNLYQEVYDNSSIK